jgi:hypothetical protein
VAGTTGYRLSLARTLLFALAYAGACYVGRALWLGYEVNLVWPAAGVAVVWFCAHLRTPTRRLDMVLLALILGGMDWLTGASAASGVVAGIVGLIQITIFLRLLHLWGPHLWGAGGNASLRSRGTCGSCSGPGSRRPSSPRPSTCWARATARVGLAEVVADIARARADAAVASGHTSTAAIWAPGSGSRSADASWNGTAAPSPPPTTPPAAPASPSRCRTASPPSPRRRERRGRCRGA